MKSLAKGCVLQCAARKSVPICVVSKVPNDLGSRVEELEECEFPQAGVMASTRLPPFRAPL